MHSGARPQAADQPEIRHHATSRNDVSKVGRALAHRSSGGLKIAAADPSIADDHGTQDKAPSPRRCDPAFAALGRGTSYVDCSERGLSKHAPGLRGRRLAWISSAVGVAPIWLNCLGVLNGSVGVTQRRPHPLPTKRVLCWRAKERAAGMGDSPVMPRQGRQSPGRSKETETLDGSSGEERTTADLPKRARSGSLSNCYLLTFSENIRSPGRADAAQNPSMSPNLQQHDI